MADPDNDPTDEDELQADPEHDSPDEMKPLPFDSSNGRRGGTPDPTNGGRRPSDT